MTKYKWKDVNGNWKIGTKSLIDGHPFYLVIANENHVVMTSWRSTSSQPREILWRERLTVHESAILRESSRECTRSSPTGSTPSSPDTAFESRRSAAPWSLSMVMRASRTRSKNHD